MKYQKFVEIQMPTNTETLCSVQISEANLVTSAGTKSYNTICLMLTDAGGETKEAYFTTSQATSLIKTLHSSTHYLHKQKSSKEDEETNNTSTGTEAMG